MNYLVSTNSAEENFNLMAKGIWTTKEASVEKKYFDGKEFGKTITQYLIATITSIALTIFSYQAGLLYVMPISATVGIYAVIKLKITLDDQAYCQRKLDEAFDSVNNIYQSIIEFINAKRQAKTTHIQQAIHSASYGMTYNNDNFPIKFRSIASNYDMSREHHFSEAIKLIRENSKAIPEISKAAFFKVSCNEYATCSLLYDHLSKKYNITAPLNKRIS